MKLYFVAGSPNCRKVQATVAELGLEMELVPVDFAAGEHKGSPYLELNPNGLVPTLVDGSLSLWESNAITWHLATSVGHGRLLPATAAGRADVMRWQCWELAHLGRHLAGFLFERLFKPLMGGVGDEAMARTSRAAVEPYLATLEAHLGAHPFLVGDALSLADYTLAPQLDVMALAGDPLAGYPNICAWLRRLDERAAWRGSRMPEPMGLAIQQAIAQSRGSS